MTAWSSIRAERGQLLVISALVVAVSFVALALVLNAGIYSENLSARETGNSGVGGNAVELLTDETAVAMQKTNRAAEPTPDQAAAAFEATMSRVEAAISRSYARRGGVFAVTERSVTRGYSLEQTDATRPYTNASGGARWTLVEDVNRMAGFALTVDHAQLASDPTSVAAVRDDTFAIRIADEDTEWRIFVFTEGADVVVAGGEASEIDGLDGDAELTELPIYTDLCRTTAESATVDFVDGTLAGNECPALLFAEEVAGSIALSFDNGDMAGGNYRLLVADGAAVGDGFAEPGTAPFQAGAVFETSFVLTYEQTDVRYEVSRTVQAEPIVYESRI